MRPRQPRNDEPELLVAHRTAPSGVWGDDLRHADGLPLRDGDHAHAMQVAQGVFDVSFSTSHRLKVKLGHPSRAPLRLPPVELAALLSFVIRVGFRVIVVLRQHMEMYRDDLLRAAWDRGDFRDGEPAHVGTDRVEHHDLPVVEATPRKPQ
jgi:hypothetical protein